MTDAQPTGEIVALDEQRLRACRAWTGTVRQSIGGVRIYFHCIRCLMPKEAHDV